jgi:hypothetical protein
MHVPGSVEFVPGSFVAGSIEYIPGSVEYVAGSLMHVPGSHVAGSLGSLPESIGHLAGSVGQLSLGGPLPGITGEAYNPELVEGSYLQPPVMLQEENKPMLQASVEMVISGRSFPNIELTIAGRTIPTGPDGGFSLRMTVPDGLREVPIEARSKSTNQLRRLNLRFGRELD